MFIKYIYSLSYEVLKDVAPGFKNIILILKELNKGLKCPGLIKWGLLVRINRLPSALRSGGQKNNLGKMSGKEKCCRGGV